MPPKNEKKKQDSRNDIPRLDAAIKSGNLPRVILLSGHTRFLLDHYKNKLVGMLADTSDTMNYTRYDGESADPQVIVEMAGTLPFFRDNRLIFVEESGFFKPSKKGGDKVKENEDGSEGETDPDDAGEEARDSASLEILADYLKNPCETTNIIFVEGKVDARKKLTKAIDAMGGYFVIGEYDDRKFQTWVVNTFKRYGKKLSMATYDHLLDRCGRDMDVLSVEMRKLADYLGDEEEVTPGAVDAVCIRSFENRVFEMIDDMMAGRTQVALNKYYDLLSLKEAQQKTRIIILRQYVRMALVKEAMVNGQDTSELGAAFGVKPYAVQKLAEKARNIPYRKLKDAADACVELESACRNRSLSDKVGTEYMILTLATKYKMI